MVARIRVMDMPLTTNPSVLIVGFAAVLCGLLANICAELFLALDMKLAFARLDPCGRRLRIMRWIICLAGFGFVSLFDPSPIALLALVLFSITAATDLETRRIPPDWFTYGSVVALCLAAFFSGGLLALRDVVVAQALCFVAMVLAIVLARAASAGDVKVLMQYGAACGSLPAVMLGLIAETALRLALFAGIVVRALGVHGDRRAALTRGLRVRLPHAPVAWVGVVAALVARAAGLI